MGDEPPGSGGGTYFDDPVFVPKAKGDANEDVLDGDADGVAEEGCDLVPDRVVPPPKALSKEEKIAWEETVWVLNARPMLKSIPMTLKKMWNHKQRRVWEEAKLPMKRVRKRQHFASERKMKAAAVMAIKHGHEEEPEFLVAVGNKARAIPPSQPEFTTNEMARLIHCFASEKFRPFFEILVKGVLLRVDKDIALGRPKPCEKLSAIFNTMFDELDNFSIDHLHGDDDLLELDPGEYIKRTNAILKGNIHSLTLINSDFMAIANYSIHN
jgi:hypothetical protein